MNDACEATRGTMAVILGLDANQVEKARLRSNLLNDLWAADFNCRGQAAHFGYAERDRRQAQLRLKPKGPSGCCLCRSTGAFHIAA